jgi:hypothetical protein
MRFFASGVDGLISIFCSCTGSILKLAELEHTQSCQSFLGIVLSGLRIDFSLTVQETLAQYAVADARLLSGVIDGKVVQLQ